jgi:hypothetical protein
MTTQQAYINGFVKRASEYGYSPTAAIALLKSAQPGLGVIDTGLGNPAAKQTTAPKPGLVDKARSWLGSKLPGYPTSAGSTKGGVDVLANQFNELAGG